MVTLYNNLDSYNEDNLVNFMKRLLIRYFPIRHKTLTRRRLRSSRITSSIMKCFRKKHRWFRLQRNGSISYNFYKVYVKKLSLLLRTAREQRLSPLNNDMIHKWKVLNGLMRKSKKMLHKSSVLTEI